MARYTRRTFRRRRGRKTAWYNRRYNAMQLAAKAWKGVRYIRGLVNSEMLHIDKVYSAAAIANSGTCQHITNIAQGDSVSGRTGNSILVRNLTYRLNFEVNSSVTTDSTVCCTFLIDTQQVGDTAPSYTDVYDAATTTSLLNVATAGRFKVLKRMMIQLTPPSGGKPIVCVNGFLNLYKHVRYNGTSSSDIQKNGIFVAFVGSEATNTPTVTGYIRIGYHDN